MNNPEFFQPQILSSSDTSRLTIDENPEEPIVIVEEKKKKGRKTGGAKKTKTKNGSAKLKRQMNALTKKLIEYMSVQEMTEDDLWQLLAQSQRGEGVVATDKLIVSDEEIEIPKVRVKRTIGPRGKERPQYYISRVIRDKKEIDGSIVDMIKKSKIFK